MKSLVAYEYNNHHRDGVYGVYLIDAEGAKSEYIDSGESPSWSPDGQFLAYIRKNDPSRAMMVYNLMLYDREKSRIHPVTFLEDGFFDGNVNHPQWSFDGSRIAFTIFRAGKAGLHVYELQGNRIIPICNDLSLNYPVWTPDHRIICENEEVGWMIYDPNNGSLERFHPFDDKVQEPMWSRDGRFLVYIKNGTICISRSPLQGSGLSSRVAESSFSPMDAPVRAGHADGSLFKRLSAQTSPASTETPQTNTNGNTVQLGVTNRAVEVAWSPDNRRLAYTAAKRSGFGAEVWVYDIETRTETRLTESPPNRRGDATNSFDLDWSPAL